MPYFSVIIPVYNRGTLIRETLDSVFAQEYEDYEVIVVDDGSTDETVSVLREYGNQITLLQQENKGPGAARNRGIQEAEGEYVTFLDSDDLWFPWTLSTFARAIERHGRPGFIAGTHVDIKGDDGEQRNTPEPPAYTDQRWQDYFTAAACQAFWIGTPAAAIRADPLRSVGKFSGRDANAEDSNLWMKLGTVPRFVRVAQPPVFAYRRHSASEVNDNAKNYAGIQALIDSERKGDYPGEEDRALDRQCILTRHARAASVGLAKEGRIREAWSIYVQTLAWNVRLWRGKYVFGFPLWSLGTSIDSVLK